MKKKFRALFYIKNGKFFKSELINYLPIEIIGTKLDQEGKTANLKNFKLRSHLFGNIYIYQET